MRVGSREKGLSGGGFRAKDRLGGSLWDFPESELPPEVIMQDFAILSKLPVEIRFETTVGKDISISDLQKDFDAVLCGFRVCQPRYGRP